ncbi:MAG: nucleotidyl transferase AbiEii/AbiGii toxin family protein [bacterium]
MLTFEGLMEQAKLSGLPLNKQRAIVREYAQTIILKAIYQSDFGRKIFFMGGTALRFAYGLKRFSEDLDFNTRSVSFTNFKEILQICKGGLGKEGFECEIAQKEKGSLLVGQLKLTNILQAYNITSLKEEKLMVKIETNRPVWEMKTESDVIDKFGFLFTILLMEKGSLFSEKLCALFSRNRGRDIYDTIFMLQKRFPIDSSILQIKGWKDDPKQMILKHVEKIDNKELIRLARQVEPFLLNEEEKDFVINAGTYIKAILNSYGNV